MKKKILCCILSCLILVCVGCGDTTGADSTVENTGELAVKEYNLFNYAVAESDGLYSFDEVLCQEKNLVMATAYNQDELLLCYETIEEGEKTQTFTSFNPETGMLTPLGGMTVTDNDSIASFILMCSDPLVLINTEYNLIRVYKKDFSGYKDVVLEHGLAFDFSMVCHGEEMYYLDNLSSKLYKVDVSAIFEGEDSISMSRLQEKSQLIFEPSKYYGSYQIVDINEEGSCLYLKAWEFKNSTECVLGLNLTTGEIESAKTTEDLFKYIWYKGDLSASLLEEYSESGCIYTYGEWSSSKTYTTSLDFVSYYNQTHREDIYYGVTIDPMVEVLDDYIVMYLKNYSDGAIEDLLVWNYMESPPATNPSMLVSEDAVLVTDINVGEVTKKAEELEEKYGINIIYGENVPTTYTHYNIASTTDTEAMLYALEDIDRGLAVFPDDMFREMVEKCWTGYNLYLGTDFIPKEGEDVVVAVGIAGVEYGYAHVYIDVNALGITSTTIHETIHNIHSVILTEEDTMEFSTDWEACNPDGFMYQEVFADYENDLEYTSYYANDIENIYFYNGYAKVNQNEDVAVTMEFFACLYEQNYAYKSEHLANKVAVFVEYCYKYLECFTEDTEYYLKDRYELLQTGWD